MDCRTSSISATSTIGLQDQLYLGNLDAKRDWGHARDYEGMWRILQHATPDDYVLATGEARTVREFVELSFAHVERPIGWKGKGVDETGIDLTTGRTVVSVDPRYFRPTEVDLLIGDPTKARRSSAGTTSPPLRTLSETWC